ncbi:MAG: amidase [Peptococcaceae bacterium BICA1-8]|nr:MAG: amidase [Peptococcaceae bacterium BICA1-8]
MYVKKISLAQLAASLRSGHKNLNDYINETCDLIDEVEPYLKALLPEPDRRQRLLKEAQELENKFPNPDNRPSLYGILTGIKDIYSVEGFATQAGSRLPAELFSVPEAQSVRLIKQAGALILGKTVTTEFAYFHPGPTRNPYNLGHTPGGSSSGSAAAVAAGFCPLAFGTQTIGSIIRPAAYCGIIGFKPSYNRIPTEGLVYFSITSDHVGLFTQDIEGMKLAASVLCTNWQTSSTEKRDLPVLGVPEGPYLKQATPEALDAFGEQIEFLEAKGYEIKRVQALGDIQDINDRHRRLGAAEMARVHRLWYQEYKALYSDHSAKVYEKGEKITDQELAQLQTKGLELRESLANSMAQTGIDLWLSPAATDWAPRGLESTGNPIMNLPWTHAGMPVISLPAGWAYNGLPLGLQVSALFGYDERMLSWSDNIFKVLQDIR